MLQMVSESNTKGGASEKVEPRRGWTRGGGPARTLGPKSEWIGGSHINWRKGTSATRWPSKGVDCEIPHRLGGERNIV